MFGPLCHHASDILLRQLEGICKHKNAISFFIFSALLNLPLLSSGSGIFDFVVSKLTLSLHHLSAQPALSRFPPAVVPASRHRSESEESLSGQSSFLKTPVDVLSESLISQPPRKRVKLSQLEYPSMSLNGSNGAQNGIHHTTSPTSRFEDTSSDSDFSPIVSGSSIDRKEFVRLAILSLQEIGYPEAASKLEDESGFQLESELVGNFKSAVLGGKWSESEILIQELSGSTSDLNELKFAIRQQEFLEALEAGKNIPALAILRKQLAPLKCNTERLHELSSFLMCRTPVDLRRRANWSGVEGDSRQVLLSQLQEKMPPQAVIPRHRMFTLIDQAKLYQSSQCLFHSNEASKSILTDCNCSNKFPSKTTHTLDKHTDEVWRLKFSHNGKYLATGGRDKTIFIWNVDNGFTDERVLELDDPIICLTWSPDDSMLLAAAETTISMWNVKTGRCIQTHHDHQYTIGALSWMPDGRGFFSGGMDFQIWYWDLNGVKEELFPRSSIRIVDLAVSPNGKRLVVVGRTDKPPESKNSIASFGRIDKRICVYDIQERRLEYEISQPGELTSVVISRDSRFALVSHAPNEVLYIDLYDGSVLRRLQGLELGECVLQSSFGGQHENYIISGAFDGKIYVWHRETGKLVQVLIGHGEGSVNAVSWNPMVANMLASACDDRTVRIWSA